MDGRTIVLCLAAAAVGVVGGFLLANSMNRTELAALRAESERFKASTNSAADTTNSLTEEEINATVARADASPANAEIQRSHGIALYRYGAMKQDLKLLQQSARILERAAALKPGDYEVLVAFGHANFDIGYYSKSNDSFVKAREVYDKVLAQKPNDVEIRTDVGLTYFLQTPPDLESSVREFKRSLATDPKHEKTLQFVVQALIRLNRSAEAGEYLEQLRSVNPRNQTIPELTSMLTAASPAG